MSVHSYPNQCKEEAMAGLATELSPESARGRVAVSAYDNETSSYHVQVGPGFLAPPKGHEEPPLLYASVVVRHPLLQSYQPPLEPLLRLIVAVAVVYCQKRIGVERDPSRMVHHLWRRWGENLLRGKDEKRVQAMQLIIKNLLKMGFHQEDLSVLRQEKPLF